METADESPVFDASDPVWRDAPWVRDILRRIPHEATFPRLMTGPHVKAVDTLLPELEAWLPAFQRTPLRWWQRLSLSRLLEVDEAGDLIWRSAFVSTSRQSGKSTMFRILLLWYLQQEDRWGDVRDSLFISKDAFAAKEILRPAVLWVKREHPVDWTCREGSGENEVAYNGNRWMVRAAHSAYGYSASTVVADEAWSLSPAIIQEGVEPLLVERANSQLMLTSTAHREATSLIRNRRRAAIGQIRDPKRSLILEWSVPADTEITDEAAWRMASPHWSPDRRELIADRVRAALDGSAPADPDEPDPIEYVAAQWLNRWPEAPVPRLPGISLVSESAWSELRVPGLHVPEDGVVAAMEANAGGAAIAAAWREPDGRMAVIGRTLPSIEAAWSAMSMMPPGSQFLCGLSWRAHKRAVDLGAIGVGLRETEQALPLLADLVASGAIVWDGDALGDQVAGLRVVDSPSSSGKSVVRSALQTHVARAGAWAVWQVDQGAVVPSIW